jgi:hypothetical protein
MRIVFRSAGGGPLTFQRRARAELRDVYPVASAEKRVSVVNGSAAMIGLPTIAAGYVGS